MPKLNIFYINRRLFHNIFKIQKLKLISKYIKNPTSFPNYFINKINCIGTTAYLNKFSDDIIPNKLLINNSKEKNINEETDSNKNNIEISNRNQNLSEEINSVEESPSKIDVDEEMLRYDYEEFEERGEIEKIEIQLPPHKIRRGLEDVYDLDDLMLLLSENKAINACVFKIPEKYDYCDYMVIVTGTSIRHLRAMAEDIKKTYKSKRNDDDPDSVNIEGLLSKDWLAIDLGNIVVHLFLEKTRRIYDLEQLWSVGPEFDEQSLQARQTEDNNLKHSINFMKDFDNELQIFKSLSKKK